MRNIDIDFLMTSLDSKASFNTRGELKENRIIFNDDEGNKHFIIIQKDSVEYHKRGSMNMKYVFNLEQNTTGTYEIDGNKFLFVIKTKELRKMKFHLKTGKIRLLHITTSFQKVKRKVLQ